MPKRSGGRKKGGHNRGFFFRKGRGWFAIDGKRMVPLLDKKGERITSPNAGQDDIRTPTPGGEPEKPNLSRPKRSRLAR